MKGTTLGEPQSCPADRAQAVGAFVARHFSLGGSIRLHRAALGWDLLRAPVNVALAPVFLATRLAAIALSLTGLRRAGSWLVGQRILLRTAVARKVQAHVREELAPTTVKDGLKDSAHWSRSLEDYTAVRSAVAEIATTFLVLLIGYCVFRISTPGVISLAPVVTDHVAQTSAIEDFPLGNTLGSAWYGVFPVELPIWYVVAVGFGLATAASLVTTFIGVLIDPLQASVGLHQRRLLRLLTKVDAIDASPTVAREHLLARLADATDILVSLARTFRP